MNILIMSDIHGNLDALEKLLKQVERQEIQGCVLLGDLIDYGMHSNEVVERVRRLDYPILCNLWGNHEHAIWNEGYERFSTDRGRDCARYTRERLSDSTWQYMENMDSAGRKEFLCGGKRCLAVHGSEEDIYWGSIRPEQELSEYCQYDYVFSGHSHHPHFFEKYYKVEDPKRRNKKKTIFVNPGSVGQPRNLNPMAQAVLLDLETEELRFVKAPYDIKKEQDAFDGQVDPFYRERLECGV